MCELRIFLALLVAGSCFICGAMPNQFNAKIFFFFGNTYDINETYQLEDAVAILNHEGFDSAKPIMLYSHGYLESAESDTVRAIVDAYIKNGNYNICVIDWRELADGFYPLVAFSLKKLGLETAALLLQLSQQFPIERIHVVGHSLGGQLAGYIGRFVISQSGGTKILNRLTALDPAGPGFFLLRIATEHITKNDAKFVDVIHTDAGFFGYLTATGTVDFWPNGGDRRQPGCLDIIHVFCSHQRSVYYWAESVLRGSSTAFTSFNPINGNQVQMGNNCPLSASGNYFLTTNRASPYSKG